MSIHCCSSSMAIVTLSIDAFSSSEYRTANAVILLVHTEPSCKKIYYFNKLFCLIKIISTPLKSIFMFNFNSWSWENMGRNSDCRFLKIFLYLLVPEESCCLSSLLYIYSIAITKYQNWIVFCKFLWSNPLDHHFSRTMSERLRRKGLWETQSEGKEIQITERDEGHIRKQKELPNYTF